MSKKNEFYPFLMTYEEEIKHNISKASKKLRERTKQLIAFNSSNMEAESTVMMKDIYKSISIKDAPKFNSMLLAVNGIIRKRDTFYMLNFSMYDCFENVKRTLTQIKDFEDKAKLLNALESEKAAAIAAGLVLESEHCRLALDNGFYFVKVEGLDEFVEEQQETFKVAMMEAKTLKVCVEAYAEEYGISDLMPPDVEAAINGLHDDFTISRELHQIYGKYSKKKEKKPEGLMRMSDFNPFDEEPEAAPDKVHMFITFDEAEIYKEVIKSNPVTL